jgi:hypothetical protein
VATAASPEGQDIRRIAFNFNRSSNTWCNDSNGNSIGDGSGSGRGISHRDTGYSNIDNG